jgi:hypothetical protein
MSRGFEKRVEKKLVRTSLLFGKGAMINLTRGFRCCLRMPKSWFSGVAKYLTESVVILFGKPRKNDKNLDKSSLKKSGQKRHRVH